MEEVRELLGLDVGEAQTGIARASSAARLAEPLATIATSEVLDRLKLLIEQYNVDTLVVGLPRNLQGKDTPQTIWVREWVEKAKGKLAVSFYWQDEALTSKQALSYKYKAKSLKLKAANSADEHALAAAIILQDFLDRPQTESSPA